MSQHEMVSLNTYSWIACLNELFIVNSSTLIHIDVLRTCQVFECQLISMQTNALTKTPFQHFRAD